MNKVGCFVRCGATHLLVSTINVILNCSYRDMEIRASYVKSLHKYGTIKQLLEVITSLTV